MNILNYVCTRHLTKYTFKKICGYDIPQCEECIKELYSINITDFNKFKLEYLERIVPPSDGSKLVKIEELGTEDALRKLFEGNRDDSLDWIVPDGIKLINLHTVEVKCEFCVVNCENDYCYINRKEDT